MVEHILDVGYLLWILFALENKAWVNKYSFLLHKLINKSILCVCQWSRNFKANLLTGKSCRHDLSQDTVQLECWVLPQFHKSWVILLLSFALSTEIICYKQCFVIFAVQSVLPNYRHKPLERFTEIDVVRWMCINKPRLLHVIVS